MWEIHLHWELIKIRIQFKTDMLGTMFSGVSVAQFLDFLEVGNTYRPMLESQRSLYIS